MQYIFKKMNYNRDVVRIEKIIHEAKIAAWGNKLVPGAGQKKVLHTDKLPSDGTNLLLGQS